MAMQVDVAHWRESTIMRLRWVYKRVCKDVPGRVDRGCPSSLLFVVVSILSCTRGSHYCDETDFCFCSVIHRGALLFGSAEGHAST
jgi:hypothetical protein